MESFIGVIIGGLIALATTLITLRRSQKLHEDNLREERRKIREEREFSSKQAAFLSASEALVRFIHYYISLPDRILPSDGTVSEEIAEFSVAFTRLHFYCELETIEKLTSLEQILNEAIGKAMKAKMPSGFIAGDLKAIDVQISGIERINTRIQDEIEAMLQSDQENPLIVSHREQQAKNFRKMADLEGQRVKLIERGCVETEKCRDVVIAHLRTIYESFRDVLLLARRELSFAIDQERYKVIIDKNLESMERTSKKLFTEIRKQFAEEKQAEAVNKQKLMN
jgi:gas vesicle protein